jgi:hypothetical protein
MATNNLDDVCGGASDGVPPGANTLGTITVDIGTGAQLAAVYMDYDVDFSQYGSFQDYGVTGGAIGATQSYELADPNVSNIFSDFAADPGPCRTPTQWGPIHRPRRGRPVAMFPGRWKRVSR